MQPFCVQCVAQKNSRKHLHGDKDNDNNNNNGVHHQEAWRIDHPRPLRRPPQPETQQPERRQQQPRQHQVDQELVHLVIKRVIVAIVAAPYVVVLAAVRRTHLRLLLLPTTTATLTGVDDVNNLTKLTAVLIPRYWQFWQPIQGKPPLD